MTIMSACYFMMHQLKIVFIHRCLCWLMITYTLVIVVCVRMFCLVFCFFSVSSLYSNCLNQFVSVFVTIFNVYTLRFKKKNKLHSDYTIQSEVSCKLNKYNE